MTQLATEEVIRDTGSFASQERRTTRTTGFMPIVGAMVAGKASIQCFRSGEGMQPNKQVARGCAFQSQYPASRIIDPSDARFYSVTSVLFVFQFALPYFNETTINN
jgi:hypothetical protein